MNMSIEVFATDKEDAARLAGVIGGFSDSVGAVIEDAPENTSRFVVKISYEERSAEG